MDLKCLLKKINNTKDNSMNLFIKVYNFISIIISLYVGVWIMFIKSLMNACNMYDAGILTGSYIGFTIFKCIMAIPVSLWIMCTMSIIGVIIMYIIQKFKK